MTASIPTFAIVGAVNHGKSSVVSTLAEDDQVPIDPQAGWTEKSEASSLRDFFVFYDTPGFQNAFEALAELKEAPRSADHLKRFREFTARHANDKEFEAECQLFAPLIAGAGIIYVVDGSRPVLDINLAEMEILRLTGQPRLAVINRTGSDRYVADWKQHLRSDFNNAVREFNAHRASFPDRIELLEALADTDHAWKPALSTAAEKVRVEWTDRVRDCGEIIVDLLTTALRHRESGLASPDNQKLRKDAAEKLKEKYMLAVSKLETSAHSRIIALFRHNLVKAGASSDPIFSDDLFGEDTWQIFGLNETQLIKHAAVYGAIAGASFDVLAGLHSLGLFALSGAAGAAGAAFLVGKSRPALTVDIPIGPGKVPSFLKRIVPAKIRFNLGGSALVVGPYRAINFPWILLDRAIGTFCYVVNRAHARRDAVTLRASQLKRVLEAHEATSEQWSQENRERVEKLFAAIRKESFSREDRDTLRQMITERLADLGTRRIEFPVE
jgi:hypothetical protein